MSRAVAVTGANGFIGRHVAAHLSAQGMAVRCLLRPGADAATLGDGADIRRVDPTDAEGLVQALDGCDALVHLAGRRSQRSDAPGALAPFAAAGVPMLDALLDAAARCGLSRIVQASSIAVYSPRNARPYAETEPPAPLNPYGLSKWLAEEQAALWSAGTGIPVTSLRIAACYGHGEREEAALMRFAGQAQRGEPMRVAGGGRYEIDQVYVEDVAAAFHAALEAGRGGVVNIGAGRAYSVIEIARTAHRVFGNPLPVEMEGDDPGASPNPDTYMTIDRARDWMDWQPRHNLEEAFERMKAAGAAG